MLQFGPKNVAISKKKKRKKEEVFKEILTVFAVEIRWSPKKKTQTNGFSVEISWSPKTKKKKDFRASHANFSVSFLPGPLKPTAFLKPMGPLKSMGPRVIVPPCPPLSAALRRGREDQILPKIALK